jgi:protein-S-isoprenylcysteine O-methyltransferase Ste14
MCAKEARTLKLNNTPNDRHKALVSMLRSTFHNLGVSIFAFGVAFLGAKIDSLLGIASFKSLAATFAGFLFFAGGFLLRLWATFYFYKHQMKVILLEPQSTLITTGPYAFSRNPLYLGGNVFMFFGACLLLGSPSGILLTAAHLPFVDLFIRREEKQLDQKFGDKWRDYKKRVRRWI